MKLVKRHGLTQQAAKERLEAALPGLLVRFGDSASGLEHTWQGYHARFSFRAKGFGVKGALIIDDTAVVLDIRLPLAAKLFEGTIRSGLEQELDRILSDEAS